MAAPKKQKKGPSLFDFIKQINSKGTAHEYSQKECSPYMLTMNYSLYSDTIDLTNEFNRVLFGLPDPKLAYIYFYDMVPKGPRFKSWPRKKRLMRLSRKRSTSWWKNTE